MLISWPEHGWKKGRVNLSGCTFHHKSNLAELGTYSSPDIFFFPDVLAAGFGARERSKRPGAVGARGRPSLGGADPALVGPKRPCPARALGRGSPTSAAGRLRPGPSPGVEDRLPQPPHSPAQKCRGPVLSDSNGGCLHLLAPARLRRRIFNLSTPVNTKLHHWSSVTVPSRYLIYSFMGAYTCAAFNLVLVNFTAIGHPYFHP